MLRHMTATVLFLPAARSLAGIDVARLTDSRTYVRGVEYVRAGRVRISSQQRDAVTAIVTGTSPYQVRLAVGRHGLDHHCPCPVGADGAFCKHLVALTVAATSVVAGDGRLDGPTGGDDDWEGRADDVIDSVEAILAGGNPAEVVAFCERAIALVEHSAPDVGDSAALRRLAERLADLHVRARRLGGCA